MAIAAIMLVLSSSVLMQGVFAAKNTFTTDNYDSTSVFYISTLEDMHNFSYASRSYDFAGKTVKLSQDIVFNDTSKSDWHTRSGVNTFIPIGGLGKNFYGTFDGQGHTIEGLYPVAGGWVGEALFGRAHNAVIKDLTVDGFYVKATQNTAAVLVSYAQGASMRFEDCIIKNGTVTSLDRGEVTDIAVFMGRFLPEGGDLLKNATVMDFKNCKVESSVKITGKNNDRDGGIIGWFQFCYGGGPKPINSDVTGTYMSPTKANGRVIRQFGEIGLGYNWNHMFYSIKNGSQVITHNEYDNAWNKENLYDYSKVGIYAEITAAPKYTVKWSVNGKVTSEVYEEGQTPTFKGSTDISDSAIQTFFFKGWDKEITPVTGNVTYTAVYNKVLLSSLATPSLYYPSTSITVPPTVAYYAGKNAESVSNAAKRPSNTVIFPDKQGVVYGKDGELLGYSITEFKNKVHKNVLIIIKVTSANFDHVNKWFADNETKYGFDMAVMSEKKDAALLGRLTSRYSGLRGIIRYTKVSDLWSVVKTTNENHAKIALLDERSASVENLRYIQKRGVSVWVELTSSDRISINTMITRGPDGIVSSSPDKIISELESSFNSYNKIVTRPTFMSGHKGQPSTAVENTLSGFKKAFASGVDMIELDVYLTRDGKIAIHHNTSTGTAYNKDISIEGSTAAQLKALELTDKRGLAAGEGMTFLDEVFKEFKGKDVVFLIDLKPLYNPSIVTAVRDLARKMGTESQCVLTTFEKVNMEEANKSWPQVSCFFCDMNYIETDYSVRSLLNMIWTNNNNWAPRYDYYLTNNERTFSLLREGLFRGMQTSIWTVDNRAQMDECIQNGVSILTTNVSDITEKTVFGVSHDGITAKSDTEIVISPTLITQKQTLPTTNWFDLFTLKGKAPIAAGGDGGYTYKPNGDAVLQIRYACSYISGGTYYVYSEPFALEVSGESTDIGSESDTSTDTGTDQETATDTETATDDTEADTAVSDTASDTTAAEEVTNSATAADTSSSDETEGAPETGEDTLYSPERNDTLMIVMIMLSSLTVGITVGILITKLPSKKH